MFTIEQRKGYIYMEVSGKLSHHDYIEHLLPEMEKVISKDEKINVLIESRDFHGWNSLEAVMDDLKADIKYRKNFNKIAMLGDKTWQALLTKFFGLFIAGEAQYFPLSQKDEAVRWVQADT